MTTLPGFKPVPVSGDQVISPTLAASSRWVKSIAEGVNRMLGGKLNVVLPLTLAPNAASTDVVDARISVNSALILEPLTATAAISLYETPYILPSAQNNGSVTFNHSNTSDSDKSFFLVIIG